MGSAEAQPSTDAPPASIWEGVYATFAEARGDAAFESQRWLDQIAAASQAPAAANSSGYILYPIAASMLSRHRPLRVICEYPTPSGARPFRSALYLCPACWAARTKSWVNGKTVR